MSMPFEKAFVIAIHGDGFTREMLDLGFYLVVKVGIEIRTNHDAILEQWEYVCSRFEDIGDDHQFLVEMREYIAEQKREAEEKNKRRLAKKVEEIARDAREDCN